MEALKGYQQKDLVAFCALRRQKVELQEDGNTSINSFLTTTLEKEVVVGKKVSWRRRRRKREGAKEWGRGKQMWGGGGHVNNLYIFHIRGFLNVAIRNVGI